MTLQNELAPERRTQPRTERRERVLIQLARTTASMRLGAIFRCHTADLSEAGVQIVSHLPLPARCPVHLWIEIADDRKYLLRGEVRWRSLVADRDGYRSGIALQATSTDLRPWQARFRRGARLLLFPLRRRGSPL